MASKAETIRNIRRSWKANTGEDPGQVGAEVLLDQMAGAFAEKYAAEPEYAVREDPETAEYLKWQWLGDDGRKLRATIDKVNGATK